MFVGLNEHEPEAYLSYMESVGDIESQAKRGWITVGGKQGITGYRQTKLGLKVALHT